MRAYEENGMPFRVTNKWTVALADTMEALPHDVSDVIESERDWQVVEMVCNIYAKFFPKEIKEFLKINKLISSNQVDKFGRIEDNTTKKGGEAQFRQLGQIPYYLYILLRVIWPKQKFDRKFQRQFFMRFPAFRTVEVL